MTIWFSSDHHCYHSSIIKHCNRPFSSSQEMTEILIQNHNRLVKPTDTVYWLGDFAWNLYEDKLERLVNRFNGKKHFILGNHDKVSFFRSLANKGVFESVNDTKAISINGQYIWLSHYPHRSWNKSFHGSFHLFAHCHGTAQPYGLSHDVGVDSWNFAPISYDMVVSTMNKLTRQHAESIESDTGERKRWNGLQFLNKTDKNSVGRDGGGCDSFVCGKPRGECEGDGHYECRECVEYRSEA
jgi:calcineurin-like phosphoesterase family protein